jgi:predicted GNAT family N-acyltransferase
MMLNSRIVYGLDQTVIAKEIRLAVFADEQGFTDEFDEQDDQAWHIEVWDEQVGVATGRLYRHHDQTCCIGRVAVMKNYRHRHIGRYIMQSLEEHAKMIGFNFVQLSAQCQAKGFYQKLGYEAMGDVYMDQHCLTSI